jgi:hypothetical protein
MNKFRNKNTKFYKNFQFKSYNKKSFLLDYSTIIVFNFKYPKILFIKLFYLNFQVVLFHYNKIIYNFSFLIKEKNHFY